jgi:hypothetical protein
MEHIFQIRLLFVSAAIVAAYEAVKAERWQRVIFWVVAGIFAAVALGWQWLAGLYAPATEFVGAIATNDETWVLLFVVVMVAIAASARSGPAKSRVSIDPYIEARLTGLDDGLKSIWETLNPLKKEVSDLNTVLSLLIKERGPINDAIADIQGQIAIDLPNASTVAEAFRNLDEAVHLKMGRVDEEVKSLREKLHNADLDLIFLLNFAVDSVSIRFLDRIISENPLSRVKNVARYDDPKERENDRLLLEKYVRDVLGWLRPNTHIGMMAADVAKEGESEVDSNLNNDPPDARPANVDPIVLRRFMIPETQCAKLELFLKWQRGQLAAELTAQRDGLMQQQAERKTAKTLRLLKAASSS